ncbi:MAG: hypothetical protein CVV44_00415 [Spirochaetae bacterium HGW-Spirochaetae-1]|jgi:hypothetical protein|nr:MAG: hypothetical protein CVV44_00415 [Spirochaetae bacterium HGW-Spirochaetae-1]
MTEYIILCQPDDRKGCSICCGLFNIRDLSRENLVAYLQGGRDRVVALPEDDFLEAEIPIHTVADSLVRDRTSHVCPYQGFLMSGKPGCLLHPALTGEDRRNVSLFGIKICDEFLCPAHSLLTEDDKRLLIDMVDDWYLYSIAVLDPESFLWIRDMVSGMVDPVREKVLFSEMIVFSLNLHARFMNDYIGSVFFYSLPEYDLYKKEFSISYNKEHAKEVARTVYEKFRRK